MLTAKDINNKRFEQTRPGYSPEEVDSFLREISADIAKYQKEKEESEKKIEVLVESVREYKRDEDALKDALIGAQKQGRAVINEAQINANRIIAEANAKADSIVGDTRTLITREKDCLAKMQREVSEFKANLLAMYKSHLESITSIPDYDDEDEEEQAPVQQVSFNTVEEKQEQLVPEQPIPSVQQSAPSLGSFSSPKMVENSNHFEKRAFPFQDTPARSENSFSDLKFGQNK